MTTVRVTRGDELDDLAVRNLFPLFFSELAAWDDGIAMNDAGLAVWAASGLAPRTHPEAAAHNWWIREECDRYAIREGEGAVGFAVVDTVSAFKPDNVDAALVDFYIAPKVRGRGVGRVSAGLVLGGRPGRWLLYTLPGNLAAQAFWRAVLPELATDIEEHGGGTEFRFSVAAPAVTPG